MLADQAAGLRRRRAEQSLCCVHCFHDSADATIRLTQALHRQGRTLLLVDACGRIFADCPTRSLFSWKQQLERRQLHTLPYEHGDGWHAPGVGADEPVLRDEAHAYDLVVIDAGPVGHSLALMPGANSHIIMELRDCQPSALSAYALIKTLSHAGGSFGIGLLGDVATCNRVAAACSHFLGQPSRLTIYNAAHEDDAFVALAVRMAGEEASQQAR